VSQLSLNAISHSQRPHCSPVTYQLSPRSDLCHLLACHLSPLSAQRRASGYQNRVHKNHEYLIICPQDATPHDFLSDRLSTWGSTAARRRSRANSSRTRSVGNPTYPLSPRGRCPFWRRRYRTRPAAVAGSDCRRLPSPALRTRIADVCPRWRFGLGLPPARLPLSRPPPHHCRPLPRPDCRHPVQCFR